jgi:protein-disulfide isomerase
VLLGRATATLVALGFTDVQCPYCTKFAREVMPDLRREYIDTGKLQFALRHLPLEQKHPMARQAAEAIECAGRQNRAWPMHDRLFANPEALDGVALATHAKAVGLDAARFKTCLNGEAAARVDDDVAQAQALAVRGTPTFFIGTRQPDGRVKLLHRIPGAVPMNQWRAAIERWLRNVDGGK